MEQKRPRCVDKPGPAWTPAPPRLQAPLQNPAPGSAGQSQLFPAFLPRLAIGLGQGLLLAALFYCRDHELWPDGGILAALVMVFTFAPPLLLQGLGRIPVRPLLIWALSAAAWLAGLGIYQHWRIDGADAGHAGLWLAGLVFVFLSIGQALLLGHARSGPGPVRYPVLYESSWRLAIEVALCAFTALLVWAAWTACRHWLHPSSLLSYLAAPLITLSLAAAAQFRAGATLHILKRGTVMAFSAVLPIAIMLAAFTILFASRGLWRAPFAVVGLEGLLLIVAINASYRSGNEWRPLWRRHTEFAAAFLLLPLAGLAGLGLEARIAQFGFTAPRVVALASLLLFCAYALVYAGAALISLGGGRWMERIESVNLPMAFVTLSLVATLMSPLGDPVRLAVASQDWRLTHAGAAPETFDYAYLRNSGLRYGHEALKKMAVGRYPPGDTRSSPAPAKP
jgi:hypothetical protein